MIQGTYTICYHLLHILIDTCASHSFVSCTFTQKLNVSPKILNFMLFVSTPESRTLLGNVIYKACIIDIVGRKLCVDAIEIDTADFNVILRIN